MKVLLRHTNISLYYAGPKHWVGDADSALDLREIERAIELSRVEAFTDLEVCVMFDDPACDLVIPLNSRKAAKDDNARAAA